MKIFISHSSADERVVSAFVELLRVSIIGLQSEHIRCTSLDGYRFPSGTRFEDQLKLEVFESEVVVALLTPSSVRSTYVLFELGARWATPRPLLVVRAGGLGQAQIEGPLASLQSSDGTSEAQIMDLLALVAATIQMPLDRYAGFTRQLKTYLAVAAGSQALKGRPPTGAASDEPTASSQSVAELVSPIDAEQVPQRLTVAGRTERLHPDVRLWLVVELGGGDLYPQTPVTRTSGAWSANIRVGRAGRGLDAGVEYTLLLVALGPETDFEFSKYIRGQHENKDGMGSNWPSDMTVLDRRQIIRGPT